MSNNYKYILRLALVPDLCVDERIETAVHFCREASIDDVMFFLNAEELNTGHITSEKAEEWLNVISKAKEALNPYGITVSLNPWETILHCDRGRVLAEDQQWQTMVDPNGLKSSAAVCPLDKRWQAYYINLCKLYASYKPNMLWIEDDFRLHNHLPLDWGGCFCEQHMKEYSRRIGHDVLREEFIKGVLMPGKVHPYRKVWLDVSRECMVNLAESIGKSVAEISPETQVGLMCSVPSVHGSEGRSWEGILRGLAQANKPVLRPHLPAYDMVPPQHYCWSFNSISLQTCMLVPKDTFFYPELENYSYSRYIKSKNFVRFMIETSMALTAKGITFSIFDFMGNGTSEREKYHEAFTELKPYMNTVTALHLSLADLTGIKVPICQDSSSTLHTPSGIRMEELYNHDEIWMPYLESFGIASAFSTGRTFKNEIVAISGQYLRNLSEGEIISLFSDNSILLEGEAAWTLYDMGYGQLAGILSAQWHAGDIGHHSYEEVCNGKWYYGIGRARATCQTSGFSFLDIDYMEGFTPYTIAKSPDGQDAGYGMGAYRNKIFILPYKFDGIRPFQFLYPVREDIIKEFIAECKNIVCPVMTQGVYIAPYHFKTDKKDIIIVVNFSDDDVDEISLRYPCNEIQEVMYIDRKNGEISKANYKAAKDNIDIYLELKAMQTATLILKQNTKMEVE